MSTGISKGGSECSPLKLALVFGVIATLAYSWAPFDFNFEPPWMERINLLLQPLESLRQALDLAPHFALFVCLGFLLALSGSAARKHARGAIVALTMLAVVIETGQLFVPDRHPELMDFASHFFGALVGVGLGRRMSARVPGWTWKTNDASTAQTTIFSIAFVAWMMLFWVPFLGSSSLASWDESFPLLVGNEVGRGRPWLGEIGYVGLYDEALAQDQARLCFQTIADQDRAAVRRKIGLVVGYAPGQASGSTFASDSTTGPSLGIPGGVRVTGHYLRIQAPAFISTDGPASRLTDRLRRHARFSVEAWFKPENLAQNGPARIVSLSHGAWKRNFTLGQERDRLVFRVRNRISGRNGTRFQLEAPGGVRAGMQHVVASYDHGVSAVFLNGQRAAPVRDLRAGGLLLGLGDHPPGEVAGALLALVPLIVCARLLFRPTRFWLALLPVILMGIVPVILSNPRNAEASRPLRLICVALSLSVALATSRLLRRDPLADRH